MSGKIPDMTARLRAAVVSTDLVEVVDTAGTDNYKVLLADLMELSFDPSPVLVADLLPDTADVHVLGSSTLPFRRLHYSAADVAGAHRVAFMGGHVYWLGSGIADLFFGHDSTFPGFYAQRTIVSDTATTSTADDYTNLYQGGSGEEYVAIAYQAGGDAVVADPSLYAPYSTSGLLKGGVALGIYNASTSKGGAGMYFNARSANTGTICQHQVDTDIFWVMRSGSFGMGATEVKGWRIGGNVEHIEPSDEDAAQNDNAISFGLIGNRWSDVFAVKGTFSNDTGSASVVLDLDQNDVDEPFIDFRGTTGANATSSISTHGTSGATTDHIQIDLNGTKAWIAVSTNSPTA